MTETMKREGHSALVHTAAASNQGQMLNKLRQKDGIALVNTVHKPFARAAEGNRLGAQCLGQEAKHLGRPGVCFA